MYSNFMENYVLAKLFGSAAPSVNCQIGLSTTKPTVQGGNITEPSGNGYARVTKNMNSDFIIDSDANDVWAENVGFIDFPQATGSWGTIAYWTLYVFDTTYQFAEWGYITNASGTPTPVTISNEDYFSFNSAGLKIQFTPPQSEAP